MNPLMVAALVFLVYVAADYARNYLSKCPKCKGSGVLRATFFSKQFRPCPRCNRKGEIRHGFGPKS
ncbi:hypothetical protein [Microbispora sp. NPDC049125]|uniref:hypothetical protein n=1 Tax=Microbispora sp. NPDC049125 TaxID=3154929 RepID=UPI00346545E3